LGKTVTKKKLEYSLVTHLADLDESYVLDTVQRLVDEGNDPLDIIKDCEKAMAIVGERYEKRRYYLSGLILAGEIFREVMSMVQPSMEQRLSGKASGRVLLGTVEGDIHTIGKGIVAVALRCHGFSVEDIGVDVAPQRFVESVRDNPPDIVGLSGLITVAYTSMRETVQLLKEEARSGGRAVPVIIGGSLLTRKICDFIGADYWTKDVMEGVRICQGIVEKKRPNPS
jgi:methylmalonyl-CoA mutase cobalamin-binding domain/chain